MWLTHFSQTSSTQVRGQSVGFCRIILNTQSRLLCWLRRKARRISPLLSTRFVAPQGRRVAVDWLLVQESLREDFDVERSWPVRADTATLPLETEIAADRDWQDSGIVLERGDRLKISCTGRFQINDHPMPWISEPQGVSIEYFRGFPLGCAIAILTSESGDYISSPIRVGREAVITAPIDCRLWLQINDNSGSRKNDRGAVTVSVQDYR